MGGTTNQFPINTTSASDIEKKTPGQKMFFDTQRLQDQPGRYTLVAESCLPILLILLVGGLVYQPGPDAGKNVAGRPVASVFITVWVLITIMLFFGLFLVSMHVGSIVSLVLIGVFYLLATLMCFAWLVVYKQNKADAAQVLLLALACMASTTILTTASRFDDEDAKLVSCLFFTLPTVWLIAASVFNYIEINK